MSATLTSNGCQIPFAAQYFGDLRESDAARLAATELRKRYAEDGYVLLRNALPTDVIWKLREAYLARFGVGMCQDGDVRRGAFTGAMPAGLPAHGIKGHPAYDFVRSAAFRSFTALPALRAIAETIFEAPASLIRRTPLRHFIPGRRGASRAHLDRTYIEGVAADVVTFWVPLGDCPVRAGGLLYLENSHKDFDFEARIRESAPTDRAHDARPLTHDLKWLSDVTDRRWLTTDFKAGDVVIHCPSIVHASTDSQMDMMRVSTDIRFRRAGSASDPRWDNDWSADDGY